MSKYDYKCLNEKCKKFNIIFEVSQSIKEDKLKTCDYCKEDSLERLITGAQKFTLKGYDWYKNGTH
jgi:putative FmdB family regulatory protein